MSKESGHTERRYGVTTQTLLLLLLNGIGALTLFFGTRYLDSLSTNIKEATSRMELLYASHEERLDIHENRIVTLETEIKIPSIHGKKNKHN